MAEDSGTSKPMRWDGQKQAVERDELTGAPVIKLAGASRTVRTPDFQGIVFHEVESKSALNKVPDASSMPFRWTVNPYRGCTMSCIYCFARGSHTYLGLDSGADFDRQIVVKTNIVEVLDRELTSRRAWKRELVALGSNTDPYQRAEGRYELMPGIIRTLAQHRTPMSILTKGTLVRRDLSMLADVNQRVNVDIAMSIAVFDDQLQQQVEPGTPRTSARLETLRQAVSMGFDATVFLMPVLPYLTDSRPHLEHANALIAETGVKRVRHGVLHLRQGAREWFIRWLAKEHPDLVGPYQQLYGGSPYASPEYRHALGSRIASILGRYGLAAVDDEDQPEARRAALQLAQARGARHDGLPDPSEQMLF